jgi:FAD/FMN-containing dehydrogenase
MPDALPPAALLDRLSATLGPRGLLTDPADLAPHLSDWRGLYRGAALCVARPADTAEVAAVVRLCAEAGMPVIPQGGNTSMVGGATPDESGRGVVLSLARLNRIRGIDPLDMTMTAEAGRGAEDGAGGRGGAGCLFPLSLGAEGTATIGGVLVHQCLAATPPCRYGNAREMMLCWRSCCRTARSGTGCAGCARTTPAMLCATCSSARRARSAS